MTEAMNGVGGGGVLRRRLMLSIWSFGRWWSELECFSWRRPLSPLMKSGLRLLNSFYRPMMTDKGTGLLA